MVDSTENLTSLDLLCALADLTMGQREAFIDRHVLHRTIDEIAVTMGCSRSNVGRLCERARERLAFALSDRLAAA